MAYKMKMKVTNGNNGKKKTVTRKATGSSTPESRARNIRLHALGKKRVADRNAQAQRSGSKSARAVSGYGTGSTATTVSKYDPATKTWKKSTKSQK